MPVSPDRSKGEDERESDDALIARILAGDDAAARRFYDEHVEFVWSVVGRYADSADETHDLAQEAFVRIFLGLRSFRGHASLRTWLFRVSYGCALDHVRRNVRRRRWLRLWSRDQPESSSSGAGDPHLRARIAEALTGMSSTLCDVFLMFEVHGLGHDQIAETLGIPEGTSKSRLNAARDYLKKQLKDVWEEQKE